MKDKIKKIVLGEIGAGVLLIILQLLIGFKFETSIFYMIGSNILFVAGLLSIIDGIRKILKNK